MQYPVPQFTDVEDKIIGSLTLKQFGIIFGAGILIFLIYSATKSIPVLIAFGLIIGLPALGVAFAKVNGRPVYKMFPFMLKFFTSPKTFVFHKEASHFSGREEVKTIEVVAAEESQPEMPLGTTKSRLREINSLLQEKAQEERDLVKQLK